jgi:4-hydroxybenzoate polyprenyltransferase
MVVKSASRYREWLIRIKPFWALSRTPHALLDMAAPILGALLVFGGFPSVGVMVLGIITVFAGYTAVYALNDVIDYRTDVKKVTAGGYDDSEAYLDGVMIRHPMAKGVISISEGVCWVVLWSIPALIGAYLLNPVCVWIFLIGFGLEIVYCRLWKVTPFRTIVNGAVKTCGPVAAVFAVKPEPSPVFVTVLFLWIFFWEIGGQNIPADWTDIEEDRHFQAQTIPVKLGVERASIVALSSLILALPLSIILLFVSPMVFNPYSFLLIVACNLYLLLLPAQALHESKHRRQAMALFNKASCYPAVILGVVVIHFLLRNVLP